MDSTKLNDWMQVIALIGVVASLIFVGMQMKQDREIALSAAYQARAESTAELLLSMSQNDTYLGAITAQRSGRIEDMTEKEMAAFVLATTGGMYLWENSYYQYRSGFLPEDHWLRIREQIKRTVAGQLANNVATNNLPTWRPEFQRELIEILDEVAVGSGQ